MKVYVAEWEHTWGECHGILGIFKTEEAARAFLAEHAPQSQGWGPKGQLWPEHKVTAMTVGQIHEAP